MALIKVTDSHSTPKKETPGVQERSGKVGCDTGVIQNILLE